MLNENKQFNIQERSYSFAIRIICLTKKFSKNTESFIVANQIIRSATSISANLYEGSAAVSKKEFVQFVAIAKKSAVETYFWLRLLIDLSLGEKNESVALFRECDEIVKILSRIILNAKSKK